MYNIPYTTEREGQIEFFDNFKVPYNRKNVRIRTAEIEVVPCH